MSCTKTNHIEPKYLNDLFNSSKNIMETALNAQNLNIIDFLLYKKGQSSNFNNFLDKHLIPSIDPKTNFEYLNQKMELNRAIENDNFDATKEAIENLKKIIRDKFISKDIANYVISSYFNDKVWPRYLNDLINNTENNPLTLAFDKQKFIVIYLLIKDRTEYLKFLKTHPIKPSDNFFYQNIKKQLIQAVKHKEASEFQKLLEKFTIELKEQYIPKQLVLEAPSVSSIKNILDYYSDHIASKYLNDLLLTLLPIAVENQNFVIIYILLNHSRLLNKSSLPIFIEKLDNIQKLIQIKNQAIHDALDNTIINCLASLINQPNQMVILLKKLKDAGYDDERLENTLVKTFALLGKYEQSTINDLYKNGFIANINTFYKAYTSYSLFLINTRFMGLGNKYESSKTMNEINENQVNTKDIQGDSILIKLIDRASDEDDIKLINTFIEKKKPNVNQPGAGGLTPLMCAAKLEATTDLPLTLISELINLLLVNRANPNAKDIFDKTALDYAREAKNDEIVAVLESITQPYIQPITMTINEQILALTYLNSNLDSLANKI